MEDIRFAEFLRKFKKSLRAAVRNKKGQLFDEIGKGLSTKDKPVIADKLEMLEGLMAEFLHIGGEKDCILTEEPVTPRQGGNG